MVCTKRLERALRGGVGRTTIHDPSKTSPDMAKSSDPNYGVQFPHESPENGSRATCPNGANQTLELIEFSSTQCPELRVNNSARVFPNSTPAKDPYGSSRDEIHPLARARKKIHPQKDIPRQKQNEPHKSRSNSRSDWSGSFVMLSETCMQETERKRERERETETERERESDRKRERERESENESESRPGQREQKRGEERETHA